MGLKKRFTKAPNTLCAICNTPFHVKASRLKKGGGLYCSHMCKGKAKTLAVPLDLICHQCDKAFHIDKSHHARGRGVYCSKACLTLRQGTPEERFWQNVARHTCLGEACGCQKGLGCCFPWLGNKNPSGYGRISVKNEHILAHRFGFELIHGPLEPGINVLHHCDNPPCCRDSHLFPGSHADNMADMMKKGRQAKGEAKAAVMRLAAVRGECHPHAKLRACDVIAMRLLVTPHPQALAETLGVTRGAIIAALHYRTWKHLA
jgi:hypothetical protein